MNKIFLLAVFAVAVIAQCPTDEKLCVDKNPSCTAWAAGTQCKVNAAWMEPNCAKSCCPICITKEVATVKKGECPTVAQKGQCQQNRQSACEGWAKFDDVKSTTECTANPIWMNENCMQSCCPVCHYTTDKCPALKSKCVNQYHSDKFKTDVGGAQCGAGSTDASKCSACKDPKDQWDKPKCAKALVKPDAADADFVNKFMKALDCISFKHCVEDKKARDAAHATCVKWQKAGECTKNPKFMNAQCANECCSVCKTTPPATSPIRYTLPQPVRYAAPQPVRYAAPQPVRYAAPQPVRYSAPVTTSIPYAPQPVRTYSAPSFGGYSQPISTLPAPLPTTTFGSYAQPIRSYAQPTTTFGSYAQPTTTRASVLPTTTTLPSTTTTLPSTTTTHSSTTLPSQFSGYGGR